MITELEIQIQNTFDALDTQIFPTDDHSMIAKKYSNMITNLENLRGMLPTGLATNVQTVLNILEKDKTHEAVSMNATRITAGMIFVEYFKYYINGTPQSIQRKAEEAAKAAEEAAKAAEEAAKAAKAAEAELKGGRRMSYRSRKMKKHKKSKSYKKIRKGKRSKRRRY